ncbi:hypothetical protein EPUS_05817 [Endocarpon pusillum Z07020]|uniref:Protein kinase domain-containing protein n=1 Tax=Endocarpon pusillum (strain Z07020 / HMAS-L-300199) TaxID=1263415 RepID=U1GXL3_ENDPU|nr:uncharacterized protein EPUS_05817 [Endocarpon pusillum Z07020]ERF77248.1 hypothetical protein EPUS_05817 [Endocarpon pusillum Z07020]
MNSAFRAGQVGVAGLSLGAFSTTFDLIQSVKSGLSVWERFSNLDNDVDFFKTQLLLQKDILDSWLRDWYGQPAHRVSMGKLRILRTHDNTIQSTLRSVQSELSKLEPMHILGKDRGQATAGERMKWTAGQKHNAESTLAKVEALLRGLYMILPLQSPHPEASILALLLQNGPPILTRMANELLGEGESLPLIERTIELCRLRQKLDEDLDKRIAEFKSSIPGRNLSNASIPTDLLVEEGAAGSRSWGKRDGKPVMVEWKNYQLSQGQRAILLRGRNDNLARMLHATPKPDEMVTLQCIGYFDDVQHKRYGFVFASPAVEGEEMVSLNRLLNKPPPEELPSLEQRYQVAYSLGMTLWILLSIDWLHKGIRSHNVLFVSRGHDICWTRPYLCGFAYSRPDKPDEISEKLEHSERFNVYRHPLAQGQPQESYRKTFDIYNFGVILFEIGTWATAFPLWNHDAAAFRRELCKPSNQKRIAHRMGVDYRDAMIKCLDGSFESQETSVSKAFFVEVVEVLRRQLLE